MRLSLWTQGALVTPKQRAYADARVAGAGPSEAYRIAYSTGNMSPQAISVEAARLEKHPTVSLVIQEAERKSLEAIDVTAEAIARRAWEIAQQDKPDRVAALSLLAKRHPEFSDKHEVTSDITLRVEALQVIANATPEQLREIAARAR